MKEGVFFGIMLRYKKTKMKNKNKHNSSLLNGLLYGLASLVAIVLVASVANGISDGNMFKGSVLSLFNKIGLTDFDNARPDVGIEYVSLRKTTNPSDDFDYYKYQATLVVRNYGEVLTNGSLVISAGENQKTAFVRNGLDGLTLAKGETFIFEDYDVLVDGKLNYATIDFEIDLKDQKDKSDDNDSYSLDVFETPVRIESLDVSSFEDGVLEFSYDISDGYKDLINELGLEICVVEGDVFEEDAKKYAELLTSENVFSYYKLKADKDLWLHEDFSCDELDEAKLEMDADVDFGFYLKAYGGDENEFAASNFLYIPVQNSLNRAEFTKLFTEYTGLGTYKDGKVYYEDVSEEDWYFPYVQTMFNYGLLEDNLEYQFLPAEIVARQEILEPVLNYFDVDLHLEEGAPHFYDVSADNPYFYFAEFLHSSGKAKTLGIYLHPDRPLSSYFLKYLIDEFDATQN